MRAVAIILVTGASLLLGGCFFPGPGFYGPPGPSYGYGYGEGGGFDHGGRGGGYGRGR